MICCQLPCKPLEGRDLHYFFQKLPFGIGFSWNNFQSTSVQVHFGIWAPWLGIPYFLHDSQLVVSLFGYFHWWWLRLYFGCILLGNLWILDTPSRYLFESDTLITVSCNKMLTLSNFASIGVSNMTVTRHRFLCPIDHHSWCWYLVLSFHLLYDW